jgi:hypothetical protein
MSENPESQRANFQKAASRYEVYATGGLVLQQALSAQLRLTTRLLQALIESQALSSEKAREILLANAQALENLKPFGENGVGHDLVGARLEHHAKALRGIATKLKAS